MTNHYFTALHFVVSSVNIFVVKLVNIAGIKLVNDVVVKLANIVISELVNIETQFKISNKQKRSRGIYRKTALNSTEGVIKKKCSI